MKRNLKFPAVATALAAAALFAVTAGAEETRIPAGVFTNVQTEDQYLARDALLGAKVHDKDGKIIGDVEDLIVNDYNQVVGVIMGTGGFLGMGEKKVGVNLPALRFEEKDGKTEVILDAATADVLSAVEAYKRTQPKKSLLERAKEKAQEITDKTKATSEKAIEQAKPSLEEAKEKAKEAYEKAKEAAAPALDAAKEAIQGAVDEAKKAIDSAAEAAKPAEPAPNAPAPQP